MLVFPYPETGDPLSKAGVLRRFKKALETAGLPERRFHDLRHTSGTRMAAAGIPMRTLQGLMGHAGDKVTERYAAWPRTTATRRSCKPPSAATRR